MPVDVGLESHWRGLPWDFFILPSVQPIHRLNNKYSICICEIMSHTIENKRKMNKITTKIKFTNQISERNILYTHKQKMHAYASVTSFNFDELD